MFRKLSRVLSGARLEGAMARAQAGPSLADACEHVRTAQGRLAHLRHPELGVLCGWSAAWTPADPLLPVCRMCEDAAEAADELAAS